MARPGHTFLVCPDARLLKAETARLLAANGAGQWERKAYWGDEDLPDAFWQDLTLKSLFATPKALVLRRAHKLRAETWDKLDQALGGTPSDVWPVFCLEGQWQRGKPPVPAHLKKRNIWTRAEKQGWTWQSEGLTRRSLPGFVADWAKSRGRQLAPGARERIAAALPADAFAADLELDKLALAAGDGPLTPELADLIPPHSESEFYEFLDALAAGRDHMAVWRRVLENHRESDSMLFLLLASLAREARTLWLLGLGDDDKVRLPGFVKQKKTPLARRLGARGVARIIDLCLEAELAVKTGARKPEQALDFLVGELTALYAPQTRR